MTKVGVWYCLPQDKNPAICHQQCNTYLCYDPNDDSQHITVTSRWPIPKAVSRSLTVTWTEPQGSCPPSGCHLYRFLCLSRCCFLRALLGRAVDLENSCFNLLGQYLPRNLTQQENSYPSPLEGNDFSLPGWLGCNITQVGVTAHCGTQHFFLFQGTEV